MSSFYLIKLFFLYIAVSVQVLFNILDHLRTQGVFQTPRALVNSVEAVRNMPQVQSFGKKFGR